jgi:uncharacterized membrane protein (UPF0136 family)
MNGVPTTHWLAAVLTAVYGLISLAGGITGYVKANSTPSLIAGAISGILLLFCAFGVVRLSPFWSLMGAIILAVLLAGRFTMVMVRSTEMTEGARITAIVMISGGVIVIISAVAALLTEARPPSIP